MTASHGGQLLGGGHGVTGSGEEEAEAGVLLEHELREPQLVATSERVARIPC